MSRNILTGFGGSDEEGDSFLGTVVLLALLVVGMLLEGGRELLEGAGPLLDILGWGYLPLVAALVFTIGACLTPARGGPLPILAIGSLLLGAAGVMITHDIAAGPLVRGLLVLGSALALRALALEMRRIAELPVDRYEAFRFRLLVAWLLYGAVTLSLAGMLHLGVVGMLLWRLIPAVVDGYDRVNTWMRSLLEPAEPAFDEEMIDFTPADPIRQFTPEQQVIVDKIIDFINQNWNSGPADKWPNPRVLKALESPGYTTYVLELPATVRGRVLQDRLDDLAAFLVIDEKRLSIVPGGEFGGLRIQITKDRDSRGVLWYDDALALPGVNKAIDGRPFAVVAGVDEMGRPVIIDMADKDSPHLLVAGRSGSGKSLLMHAIMAQLLDRHSPETFQLAIIDPKQQFANPYEHVPHLFAPVVFGVDPDPTEAIELMKAIYEEELRRETLFRKSGGRTPDLASYNKANPRSKLPVLMLVIDEVGDLGDSSNDELKRAYGEYIGHLARKGRSNGILIILGVQRPTMDSVGKFRGNITQRAVLALSEAGHSKLALAADGDDSSALRLGGRGDGILVGNEGRQRFNAPFLPDSVEERRPGLDVLTLTLAATEKWGGPKQWEPGQVTSAEDKKAALEKIAVEHNANCTDREWLVIQGLRLAVAPPEDQYEYLSFTPESVIPFIDRAAEAYGYADKPFSGDEVQKALGKFWPDRHGGVPKSRDWMFCRAMIEASRHDPGLVGLYAADSAPMTADPTDEAPKAKPSIDDVANRNRRDP